MTTPGKLSIPSMKGRCTAAEWDARVDLAACYRLVDLYGMSDMMANHISSHVPGEPGAFLINAYGMLYEEIIASSLIKIDVDGNILLKPDFGELDYGINRAGYVIHGAIHLGVVMALFLTLPYGKFAHAVFRGAALLKWSIEKRSPGRLKLNED